MVSAAAPETNDTLTVEFYANGNLIGTRTSAPWSITTSNLTAGTYVLTAKAIDGQGANTTSAPRTIVVSDANNNPTVSISAPAANANFPAPAPSITVTASANAGEVNGWITRVEFYVNGQLVNTDTAGPWSFNWTNVPAGSYAITAKAVDQLNGETTSAAINVTVGAASIYFVHTDHLNTPRLITNNVGQAVWTWNNDDPFGANVPNENPSALGDFTCNLRLPGQYFDKETNLHYNYFRDYDPAIGRYVQSDPVGLQGGVNTYLYVLDPLTQIDPAGLMGYGGGGSASKATPRWYGRVTSPVPTSTPSAAPSSPSCNGRWVAVGGADPQLPRVLRLCTCYWLCMDCNYPVMWSGNKYDLPATTNQLTVDYSTSRSSNDGDIESGNYCLCIRKPGPETGCACK